MENKDLEKKLLNYPDKISVNEDVGNEGRNLLIKQNRCAPFKRRKRWTKILVSCAACIVVLLTAILVPTVLYKNYYKYGEVNEYLSKSITEYNKEHNTSFLDLSGLKASITVCKQGFYEKNNKSSLFYLKEECIVDYDETFRITMYAIINNCDEKIFSDYDKGQTILVDNIFVIFNKADQPAFEYRINFKYNSVQYYLRCSSEKELDIPKLIMSIINSNPYYASQDIYTDVGPSIMDFNNANGTSYLNLSTVCDEVSSYRAINSNKQEIVYLSDNAIVFDEQSLNFCQVELMVKIVEGVNDLFFQYNELRDYKIISGIKIFYEEFLIGQRYKTIAKFDFEGTNYYLKIISTKENSLLTFLPILFS